MEEKLFNPNHISTGNVSEYLKNEVDDLMKRGHFGNSKVYERLYKSLEQFDKNFASRLFHEIDYNYLRRYDSYMESNKNTGNTRAIQMRTLRAIFNKAIKEGIVEEKYYPFGMRGFSVYKLREKTRKKYLSTEQMIKIIDTHFDNLRLETIRRTFLNMFYLQGMAFVDAANLRSSVNLVNRDGVDFISYRRNKTLHQPNADYIDIPVSPQIRNNFDWFKKHNLVVEDYMFPIVSMPGKQDKALYDHIKSRYKKVNDALKEMADALNIPRETMSTYVSRHSFAMDLQEHDVPREIIKELMGHQDISTTQTYLDSFPVSTRAKYLGNSPIYNRDPMANKKRVPDIKVPYKQRGRKM